jgi:hypothetical protein
MYAPRGLLDAHEFERHPAPKSKGTAVINTKFRQVTVTGGGEGGGIRSRRGRAWPSSVVDVAEVLGRFFKGEREFRSSKDRESSKKGFGFNLRTFCQNSVVKLVWNFENAEFILSRGPQGAKMDFFSQRA